MISHQQNGLCIKYVQVQQLPSHNTGRYPDHWERNKRTVITHSCQKVAEKLRALYGLHKSMIPLVLEHDDKPGRMIINQDTLLWIPWLI